MYELRPAHNTFTVILDSYSLQKIVQPFNDECSSSLIHCRCTISRRKTVILLRVIVSKQPVIGEKSLLTFFFHCSTYELRQIGQLEPVERNWRWRASQTISVRYETRETGRRGKLLKSRGSFRRCQNETTLSCAHVIA